MVLTFTSLVRVRLLDVPLERDEGEYAYAGQLILQGVPPYRLVYNMKLPGIYASYAAIMALFGQTPRGIHLGLLLVNVATALLLYALARRLFDAWTAASAGAVFAVLSLSQRVYGPFAHATHFVLLPALAGILVLLSAVESLRARPLFCAGGLLGLAFLMKQHGLFFVLFGLVWLLWECLARSERLSRAAAASWWLLLGAAVPFALTCVVLAAASVFRNFWFWTFEYARAYVSQVPLESGLTTLMQTAASIFDTTWPLWVLTVVGFSALSWDDPARRRRRFLTTLAFFSFLSICPGFYFREHYFVLLLPVTALLAAVGAAAVGRVMARFTQKNLAVTVAGALAFAAILYPVFRERAFFFTMTPSQASRATYGPNPFPEAVEIARRIEAATDPSDRIAVLGSEPEIPFYAHRRSATGHIYMYGLMEEQPFARDMQQEAIREIEAGAPRCIVLVGVAFSWLTRPGSDTSILTWSRAYLTEHYKVTGVADILWNDETVYVWGDEALSYQPRSTYVVYLFTRRS